MVEMARPLRSVLYIPASRERALEKARGLKADAIIFDLEDAVAPTEKDDARATLAAALAKGGYGDRLRIVRINGLETPWGREDAALASACDAVLIPKVGAAADVLAAASLTGDVPLWAMIETPQGILNAAEIAQAPGLEGFVLGTNDLAKDLGARVGPQRLELMQSLQMALLAARAAGIPCIDGVFNAFKDDHGLQRECEQGRDLGMDGKTLIHPAQIDIANATFAPNSDEVTLARRQIIAFDEAAARGEGVAVVDGRIVENLHVETARRVLARAEAIARLEAA